MIIPASPQELFQRLQWLIFEWLTSTSHIISFNLHSQYTFPWRFIHACIAANHAAMRCLWSFSHHALKYPKKPHLLIFPLDKRQHRPRHVRGVWGWVDNGWLDEWVVGSSNYCFSQEAGNWAEFQTSNAYDDKTLLQRRTAGWMWS